MCKPQCLLHLWLLLQVRDCCVTPTPLLVTAFVVFGDAAASACMSGGASAVAATTGLQCALVRQTAGLVDAATVAAAAQSPRDAGAAAMIVGDAIIFCSFSGVGTVSAVGSFSGVVGWLGLMDGPWARMGQWCDSHALCCQCMLSPVNAINKIC